MRQDTNPLLMIVLLLFGGVMYAQSPAKAPTGPTRELVKPAGAPTTQAAAAASPTDLCAPGADQLVADFFGSKSPRSDLFTMAEAHHYSIEFLVATVPDPVDAGTGWLFDQYLDAIESAISADDYLLDRHSLPWKCAQAVEGRCAGKSSQEDPQCAMEGLHRRRPGVVLFRHHEDAKLLVLFLVGETPTWGVQKAALMEALDSACRMTSGGHTLRHCALPIPLLGPTFSGSAASLRLAIEEWMRSRQLAAQPPNLRIISGNASDLGNRDELDALSDNGFHATTLPSQQLLSAVAEYLDPAQKNAPLIAILQEANTAYGRGAVEGNDPPKPVQSDRNLPRLTQFVPSKRPWQDWLLLPFPINISQVRTAYEKEKAQRPVPADKGGDLPRMTLGLSLQDGVEPHDVPAAQFPEMTSNADDLVLSSILSTISRENIKYVGLLATDVRDKLFLAEQIRKYCPDVRLFTLLDDMLYTHPEHSAALEGMLVASTYPLFSQNQVWTDDVGGSRLRRQFANSGVEGVYNAALALRGRTEWLIDYSPPFRRFTPGQPRRPPIWLSVVGHGNLWPLQFFGSDADASFPSQDRGYVFEALSGPKGAGADTTQQIRAPGFSKVLVLPISLFCLGNCAGYLFMRLVDLGRRYRERTRDRERTGERTPNREWPLIRVFGRPGHPRHRREHRLYVGIGFLALLLACSCLARLAYLAQAVTVQPPWDLSVGLVSVCLGTLSLMTAALFVGVAASGIERVLSFSRQFLRRTRRFRRAHFPRWTPLFASGTVAAGVAGLIFVGVPAWPDVHWLAAPLRQIHGHFQHRGLEGLLSLIWFPQISAVGSGASPNLRYGNAVVFYQRAVNPTSGVSPLAPIVFLATGLYVWSICHLRRLRYLDTLAVPNPLKSATGLPAGGLDALQQWVERAIKSPISCGLPPGISLLVLCVVGVLPVVWLSGRYLPSFEGHRFDLIVRITFTLLYLAVLLGCLQALTLWYHVRRLLRRLTLHPMVEAFASVPPRISQKLRHRMFAYVPPITELEAPLERWRQLAFERQEIAGDLLTTIEEHVRTAKQVGATVPAAEDIWVTVGTTMQHVEAAEAAFLGDLETTARRWATVPATRSRTQQLLSQSARNLMELLDLVWLGGPLRARSGAEHTHAPEGGGGHTADRLSAANANPNPPAVPGRAATWLVRVEDFVAMQVVSFLSQTFVHLRNLLILVTVGALLLLLATVSYPFQPQRLLLVFVWSVILLIVGGGVTVLVQMDRNEVLSRITNTAPNRVTFDRSFISSIATYGLLPMLTLLATLFPQMGGLWSVLEPLTRVFK